MHRSTFARRRIRHVLRDLGESGLIAPLGMFLLPRIIRLAVPPICAARCWVMPEALRIGLVTQVVPDAELDQAAMKLAAELTKVRHWPIPLRKGCGRGMESATSPWEFNPTPRPCSSIPTITEAYCRQGKAPAKFGQALIGSDDG